MIVLVLMVIGLIGLVVKTLMDAFGKKNGFSVSRKNELVFYHAGWCHFCKDFMPIFDQAVPDLQAQYPDLIVTKYQDEHDRDTIQSTNPPIEGFPTIRLNGAEFEGPRTAKGLMMFVQRNYA